MPRTFFDNKFPFEALYSLEKAYVWENGICQVKRGRGRVIVTKLHMVEGEGVKNRPIKCHLLFECPLIEKTSIAATVTINKKNKTILCMKIFCLLCMNDLAFK